MTARGFCLAAMVMLGSTAATAQDVDWRRYVVAQSGAAVDLPTAIFSQDAGAPQPGYGRRFLTPDSRANLTIQSFPNDAQLSPAAFLAKQRPPSGIIYRKVTSGFFVVSSIRDNKIWYSRCNAGGRFMNCVLINYPAREKRNWDAVVTRISNTLSSGRYTR